MNLDLSLLGKRGRLLTLLVARPQTVNDLAAALELTDNGVRAHLASLQTDGLVQPAGERPGTRKPHQLFALTLAGRNYFPTADGPLLHQLLSTLPTTMSKESLRLLLKRIGTQMADTHQSDFNDAPLDRRLKVALKILGDIGGQAEMQQHDGLSIIQGRHCPLANFVPTHPEICAVAQGLLERILDHPITEHCQKTPHPCCRFELAAA